MAHWIIEDKGFGGVVYRCSNCRESWDDYYCKFPKDFCAWCGEDINEDKNEYIEESENDIYERTKTLEKLLSGKMVKLKFSDLSEFILNFPNEINTLMIQKTFDGYCVVVDDISVRKEQEGINA